MSARTRSISKLWSTMLPLLDSGARADTAADIARANRLPPLKALHLEHDLVELLLGSNVLLLRLLEFLLPGVPFLLDACYLSLEVLCLDVDLAESRRVGAVDERQYFLPRDD